MRFCANCGCVDTGFFSIFTWGAYVCSECKKKGITKEDNANRLEELMRERGLLCKIHNKPTLHTFQKEKNGKIVRKCKICVEEEVSK